ncbi:MAG: SGNH/GDSL hydrolase family protein [Clostridia bacterium]|nr:SGNH/GDSL hydrolase family protein [Clostridia bacterium]
MKLDLSQIKEITTGAVAVNEENGVFSFSRFTEEQERLYRETNDDFYNKALANAGVKLSFKTDSKNLYIRLKATASSSRKYFSVDAFVNGRAIGYIDNFSDIKPERNYTKQEFPLGTFSKSFALGEGEKSVCLHLPWSARVELEELTIDDGAFIKGVKPTKKLLAFGDSITQGYDALRPSNRYIARLADKIGAEEFNKGIGGEIFFPRLSELKDDFVPDYITVAYGTNDWNTIGSGAFKLNCKAFFNNLSKNYPNSKIFAITPIWRKNYKEYREFGAFEAVEQYIRESVEGLDNITVISGFDLVPHDDGYFADLVLHPKDDGFELYTENLYAEIKALL